VNDFAQVADGTGLDLGAAFTVEAWFRLDGLATTDIEVAEFLMRLSADPLFDEVDLQFSEEFAYGDGSPMRRFQLSFRLSAAAEKILETAAAPTAPEKAKGAS